MTLFEKHTHGIVGTVIFHIVVLLILILFGFFTPLPLPGEEGILVNFGTSDHGLGDIEPAPQRGSATPPPTRSEPVPAVPPPPQPAVTSPPATPEPARETAMTQDYEETAAINAAETKRREEAERQRRLEEQRRIEQQRIAEAERQRQAELERQRQAELERQRQAELERQKREEEQRRIAEINSRAQGAFGGNASGPGGQGTGTSPNQGATFPGGNQGVPTGDPNAGTYGPGGSGDGSQGTGVSYDLLGRSSTFLAKPDFKINEEGRITVEITVDNKGNVVSARAGVRPTTINNAQLSKATEQAALKTKFNIDDNAPASQQGTITYVFKLN